MNEKFDVLQAFSRNVAGHGETEVLSFLDSQGDEQAVHTFASLGRRSSRYNATLQKHGAPGDRVLLAFAPGLEFVPAFFGCLRSGFVAVPCRYPWSAADTAHIAGVALDCEARVLICDAGSADRLRHEPGLESLTILTPEDLLPAGDEGYACPDPDAPAYLQYTSGTTGDPKGVQVSYRNLAGNLRAIEDTMQCQPESVGVGWMPPFHDMGLISCIISPVVLRFRLYLMSPVDFLLNPPGWLRALTRYRATMMGGPGFAYDLCERRVRKSGTGGIDLSRIRVAFIGSDVIRRESMERFSAAFGPCGFRTESFLACYGLAESTLLVTGGRADEGVRMESFTDQSGTRMVAGCGVPVRGVDVTIVDPDSLQEQPAGCVGEIRIRSVCVSPGYWNRPELTASVMQQTLPGRSGSWLRTGDLGFVRNGQIYITGRSKDLLKIRGRNLYSHEIEHFLGRHHPGLRPGSISVFPVSDPDERFVIVAELRDAGSSARESLRQQIPGSVAQHFGLRPDVVRLVGKNTLPKTSSGKLQREQCRRLYESGAFDHGVAL